MKNLVVSWTFLQILLKLNPFTNYKKIGLEQYEIISTNQERKNEKTRNRSH